MDNGVFACADKIIYICEELKALLSVNGAFDSYRLKLLGKLQRLALELDSEDFNEDDEEEEEGSHGNTRLPFGLCQREGISIDPNWTAKMDSALGSDDIVKKIAGGDETSGSCATLCVAYIANKMGYNVLDFRGGESRQAIATRCTSLMRGVGGHIEIDRDGYKAANRNLARMEEGKEYWFEAGSHASIVRKKDGKYEYLEMQSGCDNGWFPLDDRVLKDRFKTHHTKTFHGFRTDISSHIVDIDEVMKKSAFPVLFGFLNTAADKQKKGRYGHER